MKNVKVAHEVTRMDTLSNLKSNAEQICNFVSDKCKSKKARVVLGIGIGYLSLRILKLLYKRRYDKVKYVTLEHVLSSNKKYDFIVVGAGTAGSCVAGLIARDGRRPKVLLIEAGDRDNYHPLLRLYLAVTAMIIRISPQSVLAHCTYLDLCHPDLPMFFRSPPCSIKRRRRTGPITLCHKRKAVMRSNPSNRIGRGARSVVALPF